MILKTKRCENCNKVYSGLLNGADSEFCCNKCRFEHRHKELERSQEQLLNESEFRRLAGALPKSLIEQMGMLL
jgi:hypothetical protein